MYRSTENRVGAKDQHLGDQCFVHCQRVVYMTCAILDIASSIGRQLMKNERSHDIGKQKRGGVDCDRDVRRDSKG